MKARARRLIFAQSVDVATFVVFFTLWPVSAFSERNPLVALLWTFGGFGLVGLVKIGAAAAVGWRMNHVQIHHQRTVVFLMAASAASGIVGAGFNLAAIVRMAV